MKGFLFLYSFFFILLCSCSPAYKAFRGEYEQTFLSAPSVPDYSDLRYWAAHPWKKDPSDSVSNAFQNEPADTSADVFFLHPTTLTDKKLRGKTWNADINDAALNAKTDYTSILYQASVFNKSCRVFAPRYRQAHIYSFFSKDTASSKAALDFAYEDIKSAFEYYLKNYNNGRPIIIASHSQGTYHASRLLKEFFENTPLQKKLVCAYIIGLYVPNNFFSSLQPCSDSSSTGCFVTWRTFREGYIPSWVKKETVRSYVVNPLSWKTDEVPVLRSENKGAVLYKYNHLYQHTNGARISNGVLWINKPKFPGGLFLRTRNYHPGDINFFYLSIQENVKTRINNYLLQNR